MYRINVKHPIARGFMVERERSKFISLSLKKEVHSFLHRKCTMIEAQNKTILVLITRMQSLLSFIGMSLSERFELRLMTSSTEHHLKMRTLKWDWNRRRIYTGRNSVLESNLNLKSFK